MNVEDYFLKGRRGWFRLHEKSGKYHEVPAHHNAEAYLEAYLAAAVVLLPQQSIFILLIPAFCLKFLSEFGVP